MSDINYLIAQGPQVPVDVPGNYQAGRRNALMERSLEQKMGMESKLFEQGQEDRQRGISAEQRQMLQQEVMGAAAGVIMAPSEKRAQAYAAGRQYLNERYPGAINLPEQYDEGTFLGAVAPLFPKEVMAKIVQDKFQGTKYNNPVAGVDAKGKPVFRQFGDDGTSRDVDGFAPPPKAPGLSFSTNPDGTIDFSEGGPLPGMAKPTVNALEEKLVSSQAGLDRLRGIRAQFKPEYQTWEGRFKGFVGDIKDKLGQLPEEERKGYGEFKSYQSSTLDNLNRYIKDITGASMSVQEAQRITASMPNLEDGPTAFQSKMDSVMKDLGRAQARAYYTLKRGLQLDSIGIEQIDDVIRKRGKELEATVKKGQPDAKDAEVQATVKQQLMREFGLGQ